MAYTQPITCLFCGAPMVGVHCKQICPNCGCKEDCSDLFPEAAYQPSAPARHADPDHAELDRNVDRGSFQRGRRP